MLFYLPYYIWKLWEGGLLQAITLGKLCAFVFSLGATALADQLLQAIRLPFGGIHKKRSPRRPRENNLCTSESEIQKKNSDADFRFTITALAPERTSNCLSLSLAGMQLAMLSDEERGRKRNILNDYLYTHLRHHKMYAYKYGGFLFWFLVSLRIPICDLLTI